MRVSKNDEKCNKRNQYNTHRNPGTLNSGVPARKHVRGGASLDRGNHCLRCILESLWYYPLRRSVTAQGIHTSKPEYCAWRITPSGRAPGAAATTVQRVAVADEGGGRVITAIIFFSLIAVVLLVVLIGLKTLQHFGIALPLYVATVQAVNTNASEMRSVPMLTDARQKFAAMMRSQINALPMGADDKQQIYRFVMSSDDALSKLLQGEKIPVSLVGVTYGALTVTFRLRLREFSRPNLDRLMKMEGLISQALCVESVRLMPGAGWIDCEVSSPTRVSVSLDLLARSTSGTTVALGVDSSMQPATIDISPVSYTHLDVYKRQQKRKMGFTGS